MADPPADPDRYEEAIRALRRRVPMTDPEFRQLDDETRQRAFWVAGVTQARTVQEVMDALGRALADGTMLEDFKAEVGGKLAEGWGGEDAPRLETVFRTNVMSSYNGGRTEVFDDPVVREARPYLRFDAVGDSRTTELCEALDGKVLPADDPFWDKHTPPLHFNCRSILTPLSAEEAGEEGISQGPPDTGGAAPGDGFGRPQRPGEVEKPDIGGLDDEIQEILEKKIGEA
jgi:SPP1 gp7 family putative phage head morphogenesis protein